MTRPKRPLVHRLIARCAMAIALIVPFSAGTHAAGAQARWVVKLGTSAFAQAPAAQALARVGDAIDAAYPGRFWVKRIVDGAMARDRAALARVAAGEVQGYAASYEELVAAVPGAIALSAPFAFDDERDAEAVLRGNGGGALEAALAEQGIRMVAAAPCESRVLLSRSRAVRSPADASGLTIATGKDAARSALASALALAPVEDPHGADVRDATLSQLAASGAFFDARHLTLTDHALECSVLVLSQRWIDGLPQQMQETLNHLSAGSLGDAKKAQRAARDAILARAKALGVEVISLDAKQRRAFVEATRSARAQLNGEPGSLARKLTLAAQAR